MLIQAPVSTGTYVSSLPTISGTANANGGALSTMKVAIEENPPSGNFWNPGTQAFDLAPSDPNRFFATQGTLTSWYATGTSTPVWVSDTDYKVQAVATDQAGNKSAVAERSFTFDNEEPVGRIGTPASRECVPAGGDDLGNRV